LLNFLKENVFPTDINADCIINTEGKTTDVYYNNKVLTLITGKYQNTNTEGKLTGDYFNTFIQFVSESCDFLSRLLIKEEILDLLSDLLDFFFVFLSFFSFRELPELVFWLSQSSFSLVSFASSRLRFLASSFASETILFCSLTISFLASP
jgi:hypothetical protein